MAIEYKISTMDVDPDVTGTAPVDFEDIQPVEIVKASKMRKDSMAFRYWL